MTGEGRMEAVTRDSAVQQPVPTIVLRLLVSSLRMVWCFSRGMLLPQGSWWVHQSEHAVVSFEHALLGSALHREIGVRSCVVSLQGPLMPGGGPTQRLCSGIRTHSHILVASAVASQSACIAAALEIIHTFWRLLPNASEIA